MALDLSLDASMYNSPNVSLEYEHSFWSFAKSVC